MKLLALPCCCVDYYPQLDKFYLGGNSLNVSSMWKKMDSSSHISVITCLGNDSGGKMINDFFNRINIDTSRVYNKEGITASNKLKVDEHGERFSIEGAWIGGLYETFLLSEKDWDWVSEQDIVAIPGNNNNFNDMIKRKHDNQLLSIDYLDVENKIPIEETIDFTDIAFITARSDLLEKYKSIAFSKNKLLVVTLGAEGSYAFHNGQTYHQPAIPVPKVIDTTGCGDAYQAAFALTYYKTGNIPESMLAGAIAASQILQAWGGVGEVDKIK